MDISKNTMTENKDDWYIQILNWLFEHAIVWTSFILGWKAIDVVRKEWLRVQKEKAEAKEARIRAIVQEEVNRLVVQQLDTLSSEVRILGEAIFKLNTRL